MVIVVTIIVILVAALILVTIFGKQLGIITNTVDDATIRANCQLKCSQLCTGKPAGAAVDLGNIVIGGESKSCSDAGISCSCGGSALGGAKTEFA